MAERVMVDSARDRAQEIIATLRRATVGMPAPAVTQIINEYGRDPFLILVFCLLSLRAKDTKSLPVSLALFAHSKTPQELLAIPRPELEKIIHPLGFYRQKAKTLHEVARELIDRFKGKVPSTEAELLSIKGIGRKTANLVLGEAFCVPAICVDIHVHRISNRLGLVKTETPEQTEEWLKYVLPKDCWIEINRLLVTWGQQVCLPVRPRCSGLVPRSLKCGLSSEVLTKEEVGCSRCALENLCFKFDITKSR